MPMVSPSEISSQPAVYNFWATSLTAVTEYIAFVGAAEDAGDVAAYSDACFLGFGHYGLEAFQAFGDGAIDIFLGEAFAGGGEDCDLFNIAGHGLFKAFEVWN